MASIRLPSGLMLTNVHEEWTCSGRHCVIHNPSAHHMRNMPLIWRNDTQVFERHCQHGTGHPDPDQLMYWRTVGQEWKMDHNCCWMRCCADKTIEGEVVVKEIQA